MKYLLTILLAGLCVLCPKLSSALSNNDIYERCFFKVGDQYYVKINAPLGSNFNMHIYTATSVSSYSGPVTDVITYPHPTLPARKVYVLPLNVTPYTSPGGCIYIQITDGLDPNYSAAKYYTFELCECDQPSNPEPCNASYMYSIHTQNPGQIDFWDGSVAGANTFHKWTVGGSGATYYNPSSPFSLIYPTGFQNMRLDIVNPEDPNNVCYAYAEFCVNEPEKLTGDILAIDNTIYPDYCVRSSDFTFDRSCFFNGTPTEVGLTPTSGVEPYYYITWGDGTYSFSYGAPMSFIKTYATFGTYNVCLQTGTGDDCKTCMEICVAEEVAPERIERTTNVKNANNEASSSLSIVPNPASTDISLQFNTAKAENAEIRIVDIVGKVVFKQNVNTASGINKFSVPVVDFSDGIYIVQINGKSVQLKSRFVKN